MHPVFIYMKQLLTQFGCPGCKCWQHTPLKIRRACISITGELIRVPVWFGKVVGYLDNPLVITRITAACEFPASTADPPLGWSSRFMSSAAYIDFLDCCRSRWLEQQPGDNLKVGRVQTVIGEMDRFFFESMFQFIVLHFAPSTWGPCRSANRESTLTGKRLDA